MTDSAMQTGYAPVNGLQMYYEIHGEGEPLLLLHGAYGMTGMWGPFVPALAPHRQVILVDMQAHGRTGDIDRPLTIEYLADDAAALLTHLGIEQADVFGYSLGGGVAMQLARTQPALVRKLVVAAANFHPDGYYPEVLAGLDATTPETFAGSPMETFYTQVAPNPDGFPGLVEKLVELNRTFTGWPAAAVREIAAPTLIINGDADVVRPEHAIELFRLLGGGAPGDLAGLPTSQLAIVPGKTHVSLITEDTDVLAAMIVDFLAEPVPASG